MEQAPREPSDETPGEPRTWEVEQIPVPRVYVASLSDYNAGRPHGAWIDAAQDPAVIEEAIAGMLAASPGGWPKTGPSTTSRASSDCTWVSRRA